MKESNKYAFFDFCETLADFQTADAFVDYVRENTSSKRATHWERIRIVLCQIKIISVVSRIIPRASIHKRLKLYQLKGFSYSELDALAEKYYVNKIRPHFIEPLLIRLKQLQDEGYNIGLVSGGYEIYLKKFAKEFNVDFIISSRIGFKNGICTGRMDGLDCLDNNKITLLNQHFPDKPISSIAFSDSKSDIPFLCYAETGVVVSHSKHQSWIDKYKFNEIIWD